MSLRRQFLQGLFAGVVIGLASSLPGLSRTPVKPERPPTAVERVVCPVCGLDSADFDVWPKDPSATRAAALAQKVLRTMVAEQISTGECPICRVTNLIGYPPPFSRDLYARTVLGNWLSVNNS